MFKIIAIFFLGMIASGNIANAACQFGSPNYQQCVYNEMMASTSANQSQTLTSRPNPQGGYDYSNGVTSRPNPQGGYNYSNGVTCQRNPFGGQDCRRN